MDKQPRLRAALCCLVVVSLVAAAAPAGAIPPPRPLCDACGDSLERTVESRGVVIDGERVTEDLRVERSTATVRVHENGTATWVVRNLLGDSPGAERLRSNASYRDRVADRAMWDAEFLAATVEGDVLELRYRESDFAERSIGGAYRTGEFTSEYGYRNLDGLGADRLVVVAPEGTRVGWTVSDATVSDDGRRMILTDLDEEGFVTFVPRDAALAPLWSALAVAGAVAPAVATNAVAVAAVPAALFGLSVGWAPGVRQLGDRIAGRVGLDPRGLRNAPGVGLAAVGSLFALPVLALALGGVAGRSLLPVFGAGVGFVILGGLLTRPAVRERASYRTLAATGAAGVLVAGATADAAAGFAIGIAAGLPFLVPVFALLPAGYALGVGRRRLAAGTAAAGFALGVLPVVPLAAPGAGLLLGVLAVGTAAGAAITGAPLLAAGASLARPQSTLQQREDGVRDEKQRREHHE